MRVGTRLVQQRTGTPVQGGTQGRLQAIHTTHTTLDTKTDTIRHRNRPYPKQTQTLSDTETDNIRHGHYQKQTHGQF